jgi:pimeloyl-ACP methyl ester carboxylesterase
VWGEHDGFYNLRAAEQLRRAVPGAQLVTLAGAGHLLSVERPVELTELMRAFFAAPTRFSATRLPGIGGSRAG